MEIGQPEDVVKDPVLIQRPRLPDSAYQPPDETCVQPSEPSSGDQSCEERCRTIPTPAESSDLMALYEDVDWVTLDREVTPSRSRGTIAAQVDSVQKVPYQIALSTLQEEPERVQSELRAWLGPQYQVLQDSAVIMLEVFTGKAPLSRCSDRMRQGASIRIGTQWGQDLKRSKDRRLLLWLIGLCRPKDVWISWPCTAWAGWSRLNMSKSHELKTKILQRRESEKVFLELFEKIWRLQRLLGGHVHGENPTGSEAWEHIVVGPAFEANFHMCAVGLRHPETRLPIRKPTRVLTSDPTLAEMLSKCTCPGHPEGHACLEGSYKGKPLTAWAETYPEELCRRICKAFAKRDPQIIPDADIFVETDAEADSERESAPEDVREQPEPVPRRVNYQAIVQKLHVNTGHASVPQLLRLAQRARAPQQVVQAIRSFKCPVCEELQVPPTHKVAALQHTETPNHIVGLDVVQVELKRDTSTGVREDKFNVLTAVDYATDFAQQIVLPDRPNSVSRCFHNMWCRPYGPPKVVYVDPDQRWLSDDFQHFLHESGITLLSCATESHWQLGRVEVAQRVLRNMAQRTWRTASRPGPEIIETCASVRNEQLRRHGFSSAQWFLGREPRVPGSLADVSEQSNLASQDAVLSQQDFAAKMYCRQQAAHAFIEAHAHETWRRAIRGRSRPIRGPYVIGQSVYVFRKSNRGLLSTRHGVWRGPGKIVGTESFLADSPVPRVIWVVINGMMYKCSPETLRPVAQDELAFRSLAREFESGRMPPELDVRSAQARPVGMWI